MRTKHSRLGSSSKSGAIPISTRKTVSLTQVNQWQLCKWCSVDKRIDCKCPLNKSRRDRYNDWNNPSSYSYKLLLSARLLIDRVRKRISAGRPRPKKSKKENMGT